MAVCTTYDDMKLVLLNIGGYSVTECLNSFPLKFRNNCQKSLLQWYNHSRFNFCVCGTQVRFCVLLICSYMHATHELCTLLLACCMPMARFNFCVCDTQVRFCVLLMCSYMHATHELCTLLLACCMPVARFNFCVCGTQALWYISACLPGRRGTCAACLPGRCVTCAACLPGRCVTCAACLPGRWGTCAASLPGRCLVGVVHVLHVCLVDVGTLPLL